MHNKVPYYFDPSAERAGEHLTEIFEAYKQEMSHNRSIDVSALKTEKPLEHTLNWMQDFQDKFNYNGICLHSFNGKVGIMATSTIEVEGEPRTVEIPAQEPEVEPEIQYAEAAIA